MDEDQKICKKAYDCKHFNREECEQPCDQFECLSYSHEWTATEWYTDSSTFGFSAVCSKCDKKVDYQEWEVSDFLDMYINHYNQPDADYE